MPPMAPLTDFEDPHDIPTSHTAPRLWLDLACGHSAMILDVDREKHPVGSEKYCYWCKPSGYRKVTRHRELGEAKR